MNRGGNTDMSDEGRRRESLRVTLIERLSFDELREASFDLAFSDYEGLTKRELAIDLMEFLHQRGRLEELVSWLMRNRSDIDLDFWEGAALRPPVAAKPATVVAPRDESTTLPGKHRGARSWLAILLGLMTLLVLLITLLSERLTSRTGEPAVAARVTATRTPPLSRATPVGGDVPSGPSATPAIQASEPLVVRRPLATATRTSVAISGTPQVTRSNSTLLRFCTESGFDRPAEACRASQTVFPAGTDSLYASWMLPIPTGFFLTQRWYKDDELFRTIERSSGSMKFTTLSPIFVRPGSKSLPSGIYRLELALQGSPIPILVGRFTVQ